MRRLALSICAGCYPIANDTPTTGKSVPSTDTALPDTMSPADTSEVPDSGSSPDDSGGYASYGYWYTGSQDLSISAVHCDPYGDVFLFATVLAPSVRAVVFMEETGAGEPHWSESHTLAVEYDAGTAIGLSRTLSPGVGTAAWVPDVNTVFSCEGHIEADGVMSYAFQAYDADDVPTACLFYGHDPIGMRDRVYDRVHEPDFALSGCVPGAPSE